MELDELIGQIENSTVREWARANPALILDAIEAEYRKALSACCDCAVEAPESQRCTACGEIGCGRCAGCCLAFRANLKS
jgi:hypothetical protein